MASGSGDLINLNQPEINLTRFMQLFHKAYSPKEDELEALIHLRTIISPDPTAVLTNPQK